MDRSISGNFALLAICAVFGVLFSITPHAEAQGVLGQPVGATLLLNPQFPEPFETVVVSLDDYSLDAVGATIVWYIDGVEEKTFQNERTIELIAPALGEEMRVAVSLVRTGAPTLRGETRIVPTTIDIIIESETYVPSFYKGRALPSDESLMRLIAVVHDGSSYLDTAYTYTWSDNGSVLFGGASKGKHVAELKLSRYGTREIEVTVVNPEGVTIGKRSVVLRAQQPEIHFYEENALRGLSEKEIANPLPLIGDETTLHAEPYFINTGVGNSDARFRWHINGEDASSDPLIPNALTLRRIGGGGEARIDLTVITEARIPQMLEHAFTILF